MNSSTRILSEVFSEIITGRGVTRSKHELVLEGRPVVSEFLGALQDHGYRPTTVAGVIVQIGERAPAFYVDGSTAYFGWVFWEKFTQKKARKLWGSAIRNGKGDWAIQISSAKDTEIYANPDLTIEMDADNPLYL